MKTQGNQTQRLIVLVPHRDARLPLRAWSASLFAAGVEGAWSFPWVAPLATVSRRIKEEELKRLAHVLREQVIVQTSDGKIIGGAPEATPFLVGGAICDGATCDGDATCGGAAPAYETFIYGPRLNIDLPASFFAGADADITRRFSPLVLGSALIHGAVNGGLPPPPPLSFRAAAVANMSYRPLPSARAPKDCSFEWSIGKLCWLPSRRGRAKDA